MEQKPLKLEVTTGQIKQFGSGDSLPIEAVVVMQQGLINRMLLVLFKNGISTDFVLSDPILSAQVQIALQATT